MTLIYCDTCALYIFFFSSRVLVSRKFKAGEYTCFIENITNSVTFLLSFFWMYNNFVLEKGIQIQLVEFKSFGERNSSTLWICFGERNKCWGDDEFELLVACVMSLGLNLWEKYIFKLSLRLLQRNPPWKFRQGNWKMRDVTSFFLPVLNILSKSLLMTSPISRNP